MIVNTHLRNLSNKLVRQTRVLWLHKSDIQIIAIRRTNQVEKHKKQKQKFQKLCQARLMQSVFWVEHFLKSKFTENEHVIGIACRKKKKLPSGV